MKPAPERSGSYLRRHWRGDLPLAAAVLVGGALVWVVVQLVAFAGRRVPLTDHPHAAAGLLLLEITLLLLGAMWWGVGVVRSAGGHTGRGGSASVALLTGAVGLGAFVWAGLFWWQSARHVVPDVWATLTGEAPPAAVQPAGRDVLRVSGELEFGTTRAVRAALEANAAITTVLLDSHGGRVEEGLALGRLILERGRHTQVLGECSSACVTAFAGGARRMLGPQARLGFHSVGGKGVSAANLAAANRRSDQFMANRGIDVKLLEEGAAVASDRIWFPPSSVLMRAGVATEIVGSR